MNEALDTLQDRRTYVAGHNGMVGGAILRALQGAGCKQLITADRSAVDLCDPQRTEAFFAAEKPEVVFVAAAKVGGIHANEHYPAEFIHSNLMIAANTIHSAWQHGVERLLFLGSSCIYPRSCPQPMTEELLLSGQLEPTNEPYAIAKIAGIKLCESYTRQHGCDFRSAMPCNLYGPGDNYHPQNSHVVPALIRKFCAAADSGQAEVELWGSGVARREFLHADDLAEACLFLMGLQRERYDALTRPQCSHINVGWGQDISIAELATLVGELCGFTGQLRWDTEKPDGTPLKMMDITLLNQLGWQPKISLREGLESTIRQYRANSQAQRQR